METIKLKKIESEQEYWEQHKIYKKKLAKYCRKGYKYLLKQDEFIDGFESILLEMEFIGLTTHKWTLEQMQRLFNELNSPNEFKNWVERSKKRLIKKIPFIKDREEKNKKQINKIVSKRMNKIPKK